jgi:hypothetical protein
VFVSPLTEVSAVGMWESRVLREISKRRWESFCDFHGRGISTAAGRRPVVIRDGGRATPR